jgi:uncharacterized membrane protein
VVDRHWNGATDCRFVLRPNCSASWREIKIFIAVIGSVCLGVATGFAIVGFWPVLPFAGAEMALLTGALWFTHDRARETEVVEIREDEIAVEKGRREPERRWKLQRAWARVSLDPPRAKHHPSHLFIGSHGRRIALGRFLTEDERQGLARDLRSVLAGRKPTMTPAPDDQF